jgi:hypothetical protein
MRAALRKDGLCQEKWGQWEKEDSEFYDVADKFKMTVAEVRDICDYLRRVLGDGQLHPVAAVRAGRPGLTNRILYAVLDLVDACQVRCIQLSETEESGLK